jgi:hypothetical protein
LERSARESFVVQVGVASDREFASPVRGHGGRQVDLGTGNEATLPGTGAVMAPYENEEARSGILRRSRLVSGIEVELASITAVDLRPKVLISQRLLHGDFLAEEPSKVGDADLVRTQHHQGFTPSERCRYHMRVPFLEC